MDSVYAREPFVQLGRPVLICGRHPEYRVPSGKNRVDTPGGLCYGTERLEFGPVAQLDRATDYGSVGQGFESSRARQPDPGQSPGLFYPHMPKEIEDATTG